jgi:hypothetical protein
MKNFSLLIVVVALLNSLALGMVNSTVLSNICKNCIDNGQQFCPNSRYTEGSCCSSPEDFCPSQGTPCANEFELLQQKYWICPNEQTCGAAWSRTLMPPADGTKEMYEHLQSTTFKGDLCGFEFKRPGGSDTNDVVFLRIEYLNGINATVFKGMNI